MKRIPLKVLASVVSKRSGLGDNPSADSECTL
jgi:hypothetical protein